MKNLKLKKQQKQLVIVDNYLTDKNNNKVDLGMFSIEEATAMLNSLFDCKNCVDCSFLESCIGCLSCDYCFNTVDSDYCYAVDNSISCSWISNQDDKMANI